jgi:trimeric autotransporter adhesin
LGYDSLSANTTGGANTAIGHNSLCANTTASNNTAIGRGSLQCNTTGRWNTAVGDNSMQKTTTGERNTSIGQLSMGCKCNTTGSGNTAVGGTNAGTFPVLWSNTTGCNNTAFGSTALANNTTGSNNIGIGFESGCDAMANITTGSNQIAMGNNSHTCARIKIAWTVTSDARDKTCFDAVPHGLCFVNQLNPVSFKFKKSRDSDYTTGNKRYGFKAQDILPLEQGDPVIISNDDPESLKYNESSLIPVLVNAVKELTKKVESLESK